MVVIEASRSEGPMFGKPRHLWLKIILHCYCMAMDASRPSKNASCMPDEHVASQDKPLPHGGLRICKEAACVRPLVRICENTHMHTHCLSFSKRRLPTKIPSVHASPVFSFKCRRVESPCPNIRPSTDACNNFQGDSQRVFQPWHDSVSFFLLLLLLLVLHRFTGPMCSTP